MPVKREPAAANIYHVVCFEFTHEAVLHVYDGERRRGYKMATDLIPSSEWEESERGEAWISFTSSVPFDQAEIDACLKRIEILDLAAEAMIHGTQAART